MFRLALCVVAGLLLSAPAMADHRDRGHHHGHHHHGHHRHAHYPRYRRDIVYVPERVVEYVPVQPRYYAPPPPPPVSYYRYDQRNPQGLIGGVVGGVMGYELGRGDPLAAGIGAAAGAWLGNGMY